MRNIGLLGQGNRGLGPLTVVDDDAWLGVSADLMEFVDVQPPVERHEQCAEAHAGELHLEHAGIVLGDESQSITVGDTELLQDGGKTGHPLFHFSPACPASIVCTSQSERIAPLQRVIGHPVRRQKYHLAPIPAL